MRKDRPETKLRHAAFHFAKMKYRLLAAATLPEVNLNNSAKMSARSRIAQIMLAGAHQKVLRGALVVHITER